MSESYEDRGLPIEDTGAKGDVGPSGSEINSILIKYCFEEISGLYPLEVADIVGCLRCSRSKYKDLSPEEMEWSVLVIGGLQFVTGKAGPKWSRSLPVHIIGIGKSPKICRKVKECLTNLEF